MAAKKSSKKKSSGSKKKVASKKKSSAKKKSKRCAATIKDPKTGRKRRCKNMATGNSKYCISHKKKK
ncbi:MAG TPA: hypothetical protein VJ912_01020 [Candidatus Nanoarchaeia archaeon]|nr:hypothetical protein [Candidatus Nanoarchaeia archaeon]